MSLIDQYGLNQKAKSVAFLFALYVSVFLAFPYKGRENLVVLLVFIFNLCKEDVRSVNYDCKFL